MLHRKYSTKGKCSSEFKVHLPLFHWAKNYSSVVPNLHTLTGKTL